LPHTQAYGRSIRAKADWAKTYILDSGFISFVARNASILPKWFTRAIKEEGRKRSTSIYRTSKNITIQEQQQQPVIVTRSEKKRASLLDYSEKEKPTPSHNLLNWL
jgi:hypothetical protein